MYKNFILFHSLSFLHILYSTKTSKMRKLHSNKEDLPIYSATINKWFGTWKAKMMQLIFNAFGSFSKFFLLFYCDIFTSRNVYTFIVSLQILCNGWYQNIQEWM